MPFQESSSASKDQTLSALDVHLDEGGSVARRENIIEDDHVDRDFLKVW